MENHTFLRLTNLDQKGNDVTMDTYDGAEVGELVGTFILFQLLLK